MNQNSCAEATPQIKLGHLLAPFGWAADALATMVKAEPKLLIHLFELDSARMHLIALAFAHITDVPPEILLLLLNGPVRETTEQILGHYPSGIKRVLDHLPGEVLAPENYRHLIELLADPTTAKLLHHAQLIDDRTIKTLHGAFSSAGPDVDDIEPGTASVRAEFGLLKNATDHDAFLLQVFDDLAEGAVDVKISFILNCSKVWWEIIRHNDPR